MNSETNHESGSVVGPFTVVIFMSLLAGQFTLERLGVANPFPIPERAMVAVALLLLTLPWIARRPPSMGHVPTYLLAPPAYQAVTYFWAPPSDDLVSTLVDLLCMLAYGIALLILLRANAEKVARTLMWCSAGAGIVFAVAGLAGGGAGRISAFGGGPNVFARITVLGVIALIWLVTTGRVRPLALALAPFLLAATVMSGSRGGMVAALAAGVALLPALRRLPRVQLASLALATLLGGYVMYSHLGGRLSRTLQDRVIELTFQQGYSSGRGPLLSTALDIYREYPITGSGLHGFAALYGQSVGFPYPHNMFAQAAAEGGTVGLIVLIWALTRGAIAAYRARINPDVRAVGVSFLIIFISSMFSGDYYDNRFMWAFLMAAVALAGSSQQNLTQLPTPVAAGYSGHVLRRQKLPDRG